MTSEEVASELECQVWSKQKLCGINFDENTFHLFVCGLISELGFRMFLVRPHHNLHRSPSFSGSCLALDGRFTFITRVRDCWGMFPFSSCPFRMTKRINVIDSFPGLGGCGSYSSYQYFMEPVSLSDLWTGLRNWFLLCCALEPGYLHWMEGGGGINSHRNYSNCPGFRK